MWHFRGWNILLPLLHIFRGQDPLIPPRSMPLTLTDIFVCFSADSTEWCKSNVTPREKIVDFNRFQWPSFDMGCQPLRWIYRNAISSAGLGKSVPVFSCGLRREETERERERERERCWGGQAWELESTTVREMYLLWVETSPICRWQ